jgi:hypothetical protein
MSLELADRHSQEDRVRKIVVAAVVVALVSAAPTGASAAVRSAKFRTVAGRSAKQAPGLYRPSHDSLYRAYKSGKLSAARYSLQRALSLYRYRRVDSRYARVARVGGRDATLVLRDLVVHRDELSGSDRRLADRILARPGDPQSLKGYRAGRAEVSPLCTTNVCVHYVTTGPDAPDPTDADVNGEPDYIDAVAATFEEVWTKEVVQMGYRAPLPDAASAGRFNPDARLDVYVEDLGASGLYGYCQPEPTSGSTFFDAPGYCGVDNDFSPSQFPSGANGIAALQVTAAHEFFHAVQFAYDYADDRWFMEGTATWMEDQVYDDINDNYQYLANSAITHPDVPVDYGDEGFQYGAWLFYRYLSETFDPSIIRDIWSRADGSAVGPDDYSTLAIDNVLNSRGTDFGPVFADFSGYNYIADEYYEEGDNYVATVGYPPEAHAKLKKRRPVAVGDFSIDHMSTVFAALRPGRGISNHAKLRIKLDLPNTSTGSWATAIVLKRNGPSQFRPIPTDPSGNGKIKVTFAKNRVVQVGVALTNASSEFTDCYAAGSPFSCMGIPVDDGLTYHIKAKALN